MVNNSTNINNKNKTTCHLTQLNTKRLRHTHITQLSIYGNQLNFGVSCFRYPLYKSVDIKYSAHGAFRE
jgi:hypothetical protein